MALAFMLPVAWLAGAGALAAQGDGALAGQGAAAPPAPAASSTSDQAPPAPAAPVAPVANSATGEPPAAPSLAERLGEKLAFHAFVNQAFGIASRHQVFGIPTTGTTDYRTIALQLRYQLAADDTIVVQFSNFRYGASTINRLHSDVELELGFYQHLFADGTAVKVGKMQLPLGIYNEIRDVGNLLPFYAPPFNIYLESFTSRNLEGLVVSRTFAKESKWSIDADLFGGGWRRIEQQPASGAVVDARAEGAVGSQVWLNTPVSGLRLGAQYMHFDVKGGIGQVHNRDPTYTYTFSVDGTFERFLLRAEFLEGAVAHKLAPGFVVPKLTYRAYYGQAGYNLTRRLSLNLQAEFAGYNIGPGFGFTNINRDYGVSLVYKFRPNLVIKAEGHHATGSQAENERRGLSTRTRYGLATLAASF